MATKLYPPIIDGVLPAFYLNYDSSQSFLKTTTITVPFTMNNAVSEVQIKGFSLRLRTVSSGTYLFEPIFSDLYNLVDNTVTFTLSPTQCRKLMEGQYYKLQIAYCATRLVSEAGVATGTDIGYYSTVGVIKCVSKPTVGIKGMTLDAINFFHNEFIGEYDVSHCKDQTEKVYSCCFIIYDDDENECFNSGEMLHKTIYDTEYNCSIDRVSVNDFMSNDSIYTIQYEVTTLNGLKISSPKYKITNAYLVSPNAKIEVLPESVPEYGYVDVKFKGTIDKDRSVYYLLNEEALKVVEVDPITEEITSEGIPSINLIQYIKMVTRNQDDRLQYMKQYSLYRRYPYGINNNPSNLYYYTFKPNVPAGLTLWGDYYYDTEIYDNIMQHYADGEYTDENLESMKYTTDCYERIIWGSSCVKVVTVREVEENYIDLDARYVLKYDEQEYKYYGSYLLSRASDADNYSTWYNLRRFKWIDEYPSSDSFKDFTVEHGRKYKYALQQYNLWGLYSARMESKPYMANFEDAYLYDGEKSLRIRYNAEVSSFKTTILEQKTDTIGGKYPFITRNGYTYYKEFPLGGLLAAELDDIYAFIDPEFGETHRHMTPDQASIQPKNAYRNYHFYSDENIALEKDFKLKVLEWLNNGKPKMFKSPYEGNYIVRLLNNTLTPVKELGRLLHSFSSTAYEIAEYNYDNLIAFGFLTTNAPTDYMGLWKGFNLSEYSDNMDIVLDLEGGVQSFTIQDMMPGDIIYLTIVGEDTELPIMIGVTGSYSYENIGAKVTKIRIPQREDHTKIIGMVNCYYEGIRITSFDSIIGMQLKTIHSQQFVGVSPWAEAIKRMSEASVGNIYSFGLTTEQYHELYNYNFRDYLDTIVTKNIVPGTNGRRSNITYSLSDNFFNLIRSFDPGEILDRINLTLNQGEVYKTELVNIEMLRFQLRECIPVYAFENYTNQNIWGEYSSPLKEKNLKYSYHPVLDQSIVNATNYRNFFIYNNTKKIYMYPDRYQNNVTYYERDYAPESRVMMVSTSPYGYPYPIEELTRIEMLDPFCIFKVLKKEPNNNNWVPVTNNEDTCYYDPYYRVWLQTKYNPTVKINYEWKQLAMLKREFNEETGEYELIPSSQEFYDANLANQERKIRQERGEYITEAIDEHSMYDYELYKDENNKYYYNSPHGIVYIDEPEYNLFIKQNNNLYFACRDSEPDYETTYWVKQYDTVLNLSTEKNIEYTALKNINSISMGNGVVTEISFQLRVIDYYTEIFNSEVAEAKDEYLKAKNFYTTLMSIYRTIAGADSERRKNYALKELYYRLLYGNKRYMTNEDINSIRNILNVESEKEDLELMSLYNLERMNSGLDMSILDQMVEFKSQSQNQLKNEEGYNLQHARLYDIIDTDGTLSTVVIDFTYEDLYIIDLNTTTGTIKSVRAGTSYSDALHDNQKTLYRQTDAASGKDYYYLVDKSILVNKYHSQISSATLADELIVTITIPVNSNTIIQAARKDEYMLSDGGSLIEEYTLNTSLEKTIKEQRLLNKTELAAVKIDPYFVYIRLATNGNEQYLNEESEIRTVLNLQELQGAVNKLKAISYEIDSFQNELSDLKNSLTTNSENYVKSYQDLQEHIAAYNKMCYEYWTAQVIQNALSQSGPYNGSNGVSNLLALFQYNASDNTHNFSQGEEDALLAYEAGLNLYGETQKAIEDVQLYTRMIDESVENNDSQLDQHLAKQIEEKKVWALIGLLGLYEIAKVMKNNMDSFYTLYHATGAFQTKMTNLIQCFNDLASKYSLIRNQIINSSSNINTNIYTTTAILNTLTRFKNEYISRKTRELANINAQNPLNIENFAQISIYYDDIMEILKLAKSNDHNSAIKFNQGSYSSSTIYGFNPLSFTYSTNGITNPLDLSNEFGTALKNMTFDNKVEFTRLKKTTTYYYRIGLVKYVYSFDEQTNNLNVFVFNPYSTIKKFSDNSSYNHHYTSILNLSQQNIVSSIYSQVSSIGVEMMSNYTATSIRAYIDKDIKQEYDTLIKTYVAPFNALIKLALTILGQGNRETPIEAAMGGPIDINNIQYSYNLTNDFLKLKNSNYKTEDTSKRPNTEEWPLPLLIDPSVFYECTNVINGNQLDEHGIYYDYLQQDYDAQIAEKNLLLEQALALQYLYQKQQDNYELKYNNYSDLYEYNQNLYMSFFGSEAYDYYNKVNGLGNYSGQNALNEEEKIQLLKNYKNNVKLAWYKFLELLDVKYSEEREKGMYR